MNQTNNQVNGVSGDHDTASCANASGRSQRLVLIMAAMVVVGMIIALVALFSTQTARIHTSKSVALNNIKQIALALQYFAIYNDGVTLPAAAIYNPDGKPLPSRRVAILPYIEQQDLYQEFHLDEPWDSPNNLPLLAKMPKVYRLPSKPSDSNTYFRLFHGRGAAFEGRTGVKLSEFPDGVSNTIVVIEANDSVPWTKPEEFEYDTTIPLPNLGGHWRGSLHVAFADGLLATIKTKDNEHNIRKAILRNDGEVPVW